MSMSMGEALHYLYRIDDIYYDLYTEYLILLGRLPLGRPGYTGFDSVEEIADRIRLRKEQIIAMKATIALMRSETNACAEEIHAIVAEFKLPAYEG